MEKLTVLQLSKQTGLSRTQIYYLERNNKINIINGKIDLEEAMPAIIDLLDKKQNKYNEVNFKHILNLLISQNVSLQTQLNLAHEREKAYLTELASYRKNLAQETTLLPPTFKGNIQAETENDIFDTGENALNKMESKSETQALLEPCQSINKETKSANEAESHSISTESIHNEMTLPEVESGDTGLIRSEKEMTEQNDNTLLRATLPCQYDKEPLLNLKRHRKSTAQVVKRKSKSVSITLTARNPNRKPVNEKIADQNDPNKEDHHDQGQ